ncbi:interleukin-1 receptor-associated kinase [Holotrichia oblita]|uniref:Interleukin-1 receptor-associated kinase n=1 Tax=Holotrichia oblita TaxID=644536 RepID=A0ACB9T365_HOLOL|nr:interleukin-1 receptor-associated kinase [Holotrichia oblita]
MNLTEATEIRKLAPTYSLELARLLHDNWKLLMSKIPENLQKQDYKCKIENTNLPKYNAEHIRRNPPQRPSTGPAAKVELTPTERKQIEESENIRDVLEDIIYPSSSIERLNFNQNEIDTNAYQLPSINISNHENQFPTLDPINNNSIISHHLDSDLIRFSSNRIFPDISNLLNAESGNVDNEQSDSIEQLIPQFSISLSDTPSSTLQPRFSLLNDTPTRSITPNSGPNIPDFNALRSSTSITSQNISVPRTLGSPLPSLSLNTLLKHYPYVELQVATNYFNETPYVNSESNNVDLANGRFLGSGAFGSVYLAFGILDRPIAVKKINLKDLNIVRADDIVTKQFTNEVEILYKYKHNNLLSLLGYSCDGLTYCLLYEYISGGNLKDRLQDTSRILNWQQRLDIATGTADAVAYLHTAYSTPLIHRDIKSANILLDTNNQPKLCDFGIIRLSSSSTTGTNQILGTSAYMAPEAHRGDVSVKMDTYSFGVVLLELLTGLPPIDYERHGNDIVTYVQDNLEEEGDIISLLDEKAGSWVNNNINYSTELYRISIKCLQEKKNSRPTMLNISNELKTLSKSRI